MVVVHWVKRFLGTGVEESASMIPTDDFYSTNYFCPDSARDPRVLDSGTSKDPPISTEIQEPLKKSGERAKNKGENLALMLRRDPFASELPSPRQNVKKSVQDGMYTLQTLCNVLMV